LLILGAYIFVVARRDKEAFVRMKYGSSLVDVHHAGLETTSRIIDVATMDELAKLAERHNSMILHEVRGLSHHYFVQSDGNTYRFISEEEKSANE
jgi:N-acetyl-anhydromuramyl-L-alanine amidase AmpD